jgi:tetratricopeptide (TPR) repeat protein
MKNMRTNALDYYTDDINHQEESISQNTIISKNTNEKYIEPVIIVKHDNNTNKKKSSIVIKRQDTLNDLNHVIKRFEKNNNPALSLFIAKKYYALAQYDKSYNYALITNDINSEIEASWIIFAKSLVKLNKKDMAIKTLSKYIENTHSNSGRILLDDIVSGAFK